MELLADQHMIQNGLLHLIEVGIELALLSYNTHQVEARDGDEEGNVEENRVAQLLNNDEINLECKESFIQQMIIGWEYKFSWAKLRKDGETAGQSAGNGP